MPRSGFVLSLRADLRQRRLNFQLSSLERQLSTHWLDQRALAAKVRIPPEVLMLPQKADDPKRTS